MRRWLPPTLKNWHCTLMPRHVARLATSLPRQMVSQTILTSPQPMEIGFHVLSTWLLRWHTTRCHASSLMHTPNAHMGRWHVTTCCMQTHVVTCMMPPWSWRILLLANLARSNVACSGSAPDISPSSHKAMCGATSCTSLIT